MGAEKMGNKQTKWVIVAANLPTALPTAGCLQLNGEELITLCYLYIYVSIVKNNDSPNPQCAVRLSLNY